MCAVAREFNDFLDLMEFTTHAVTYFADTGRNRGNKRKASPRKIIQKFSCEKLCLSNNEKRQGISILRRNIPWNPYTANKVQGKPYFCFSSWADGIQQILPSDWSLEGAEFSHPDHYSERNPSSSSIIVNELAVIVNLSPFLHFHRRLINYLFTPLDAWKSHLK